MRVFPARRRPSALAVLVALAAGTLAAPAPAKQLKKPVWVSKVTISEYYPAPERWFVGRAVSAPGLDRPARVDWLYSARGMSMQGEGIGLDGKRYHIDAVGSGAWITETADPAKFGVGGPFAPFWRSSGYWRNAKGGVTFPLRGGGWYAGKGRQHVEPEGITFAPGAARPLTYYRSVAVDPTLIPIGSLVYAPAYRTVNGDGWFRADDTGGAITGRHIDVYRRPPASAANRGRYLKDRKVFVVPKDAIAGYVRTAKAAGARIPRIPARLLRAPR